MEEDFLKRPDFCFYMEEDFLKRQFLFFYGIGVAEEEIRRFISKSFASIKSNVVLISAWIHIFYILILHMLSMYSYIHTLIRCVSN